MAEEKGRPQWPHPHRRTFSWKWLFLTLVLGVFWDFMFMAFGLWLNIWFDWVSQSTLHLIYAVWMNLGHSLAFLVVPWHRIGRRAICAGIIFVVGTLGCFSIWILP